jgi:hypothetical protein
MPGSANSFCCNCEMPLSEHQPAVWNDGNHVVAYLCPTGEPGHFYSAVMYVPMTNLEFLERMAYGETLHRRSSKVS